MEKVIVNVFMDSTKDTREFKRALVIKLRKEGRRIGEVAQTLNRSPGYVSKWTGIYKQEGVQGLRLKYKGVQSYLSGEQKSELIKWLTEKAYWNLTELQEYVKERYGVVYKSKQSYYDLFKAAGISWKKSQKRNPKKDAEQVATKREEIKETFKQWRTEVLRGDLVLLFVDECHLLWGDGCGYVWGQTDQRIAIPIVNDKQRQTYFGALNCLSGEMLLHPYPTGNSKNTVKFLKKLQQQYPGKRIVIIWDGASYHKFGKMAEYLAEVNQDLAQDAWKITCLLFAPYAPEQNPVEDIWLKGKTFIRKYFYLCSFFKDVKKLFVDTLQYQTFDFPKLHLNRQFLHFI